MELEEIPSRFAALRNEYCLSVTGARRDEIPETLWTLYDPALSIEVRVLYENGGEMRRQWLFRDDRGVTRLNASGKGGLFGSLAKDNEPRTGFIELFNNDRFITEEHQFAVDGSESVVRFFYNGGTLIRTESWTKDSSEGEAEAVPSKENELALFLTDYYRYTRFHSLRAIERVYHSGGAVPVKITFPSIVEGFSYGLEMPVSGAYYSSEFFQDLISSENTVRSIFSTDSRGRVLSEKRMDEDGNTIGEFVNIWSGNRLTSIEWKAAGDERRTEYEYDAAGNRISERDYRNAVLERSVRSQGANREIEELYMNDTVVLRVVWEDNRKVSEERIRPRRLR
jgi:hypothetical protein